MRLFKLNFISGSSVQDPAPTSCSLTNVTFPARDTFSLSLSLSPSLPLSRVPSGKSDVRVRTCVEDGFAAPPEPEQRRPRIGVFRGARQRHRAPRAARQRLFQHNPFRRHCGRKKEGKRSERSSEGERISDACDQKKIFLMFTLKQFPQFQGQPLGTSAKLLLHARLSSEVAHQLNAK